MKSIVGFVLLTAFGLMLSQTLAQDPGPGRELPKKPDKGKPKEIKPRALIGTAELRDGSTLACEFLKPAEVTIEIIDVGPVTLPLEKVRFMDFQGERQRIITHSGDTFQGIITTESFPVLPTVAIPDRLDLRRDRLNRLIFPESPPTLLAQ